MFTLFVWEKTALFSRFRSEFPGVETPRYFDAIFAESQNCNKGIRRDNISCNKTKFFLIIDILKNKIGQVAETREFIQT